MQIVHDFRCGTSNAILPSCGTDCVCGRRRSRGLGGVPGHIRGLLWDCRVGFGQLAPALWHIQAVAQGNESSFDLRARSCADAGPPLGGANFPHWWRIDDIGRVVARPRRGFCAHD
jgi:hypothetical protein